jgi:excinuclease ABC subunit A
VIEHNLDVLKTADHIIDLGPGGGDAGGEVIALGTPEQVAATPASATGAYLGRVLPAALGTRTPPSSPGARRAASPRRRVAVPA